LLFRTTAVYSRGEWSGPGVFVLALVGITVGLGNIWRFPYLAGEHGGGAFVIVYMLCMGIVGWPLMVAELFLGRRGRRSPVAGIQRTALEQGCTPLWGVVPAVGLLAGCLLLAAYSVVGGWSMAYVFRSASGAFEGLDSVSVARLFRSLVSDPERLLGWHTLFLGATILIVGRGLRFGLEQAVRWFVPVLMICLAGLVFRAHVSVGLGETTRFLLHPSWDALEPGSVLVALGHAFFSLTLGVGAIAAFGRFADARIPLVRTSLIVVVLHIGLAILAGFATFPFVFAADLSPASGPGLIFQTLPLAFSEISGGRYVGVVFFGMLTLAAWSSAIALLEAPVSWLSERVHVDRGLATSIVGIIVWLVGLLGIFSFNLLAHVRVMAGWPGMQDGNIFDAITYVATNLMLPLVGLLLALFFGWRVSAHTLRLDLGSYYGYRGWLFLIRFATPLAMLAIGLHAIGLTERLADWIAL
jgi:NSS family neurotransmitter:Na+ symporter